MLIPTNDDKGLAVVSPIMIAHCPTKRHRDPAFLRGNLSETYRHCERRASYCIGAWQSILINILL